VHNSVAFHEYFQFTNFLSSKTFSSSILGLLPSIVSNSQCIFWILCKWSPYEKHIDPHQWSQWWYRRWQKHMVVCGIAPSGMQKYSRPCGPATHLPLALVCRALRLIICNQPVGPASLWTFDGAICQHMVTTSQIPRTFPVICSRNEVN